MKIFLTESEVIELAYDALDMIQPDPDKVHNIALRMDMVYCEKLDMYEDVEEVSLRKYKRKSITPNVSLCSCGVPEDLHSTTMCGWPAASMPSDSNGIINDRRHPGFGKPFMSWQNSSASITIQQ